ncbi:MAG: GLPGLI family protein [Flavobacteriaceae bacterium]|nr:GLPGLI family protein [Flavobacteriaceae bacterium]
MKNLFLGLIFLISAHLFAQEKQFVEISYLMEVQMDVEQIISQVPQEYRAMVADQIRQELAEGIYIDYTLVTNSNESVYQMVEQINNSQTRGGMIAQQVRSFDKGVTYKNINENYYLKPIDAFGTSYLLKDDLQNHRWEITRDKQEIAGYETRFATGILEINDSITPVKAWFAPKIAIKDGPGSFWGLPGMILKTEFEMNGAHVIITAKEIKVREKPLVIKKPSGGKEVTIVEFQNEMKAIQEKYQEMMGEGVDISE